MHCGLCFLVCNPETRQQGFIEFNCRSGIAAAGIDDLTAIIVNTSDIVTTCDIVDARPGHPSYQFG